MKAQGYGYAIIGSDSPVEFDMKAVGATPIKASQEEIHQRPLRLPPDLVAVK